MSEPTLELQKAVIAKLLSSGPLMALVNDRVFDDVPPNAGFPRITYGDEDIVADDFDCIVSNIVFLPIHIWSTKVGKPECKEIAGMVRNILHEEELSLDGFALLSLHHDTTRYLRDPDGKTNHGVVTFRAMIDELPLVTEGVGDTTPEWVPDGAAWFADAEGDQYFAGEAIQNLADMMYAPVPYGGSNPALVRDAGGFFSTVDGAVAQAFSAAWLTAGCTIIFDFEYVTSSVNLRLGMRPASGLTGTETRYRNSGGFSVSDTDTGYTNATPNLSVGLHKAGFAVKPGDTWAAYLDGVNLQTQTGQAAPGTPYTDVYLIFTVGGSGRYKVYNITIYDGVLSGAELVNLTTL